MSASKVRSVGWHYRCSRSRSHVHSLVLKLVIAHSTVVARYKCSLTMSTVVPTAPAAIMGESPFLYFKEYAVPRPMPAAQRRYRESKLFVCLVGWVEADASDFEE